MKIQKCTELKTLDPIEPKGNPFLIQSERSSENAKVLFVDNFDNKKDMIDSNESINTSRTMFDIAISRLSTIQPIKGDTKSIEFNEELFLQEAKENKSAEKAQLTYNNKNIEKKIGGESKQQMEIEDKRTYIRKLSQPVVEKIPSYMNRKYKVETDKDSEMVLPQGCK